MRLALTQLMQSFHYGQRTLFRRLFSPVIDKLLFAATKADHVTVDQHSNMVSLLQQLIQDAWQNAAFEGISMDCLGLASIQATQSGLIGGEWRENSRPARRSAERRPAVDHLSRRGAGASAGPGLLAAAGISV